MAEMILKRRKDKRLVCVCVCVRLTKGRLRIRESLTMRPWVSGQGAPFPERKTACVEREMANKRLQQHLCVRDIPPSSIFPQPFFILF
jgi:hypothetical protein